jgi:hypothetical protein
LAFYYTGSFVLLCGPGHIDIEDAKLDEPVKVGILEGFAQKRGNLRHERVRRDKAQYAGIIILEYIANLEIGNRAVEIFRV